MAKRRLEGKGSDKRRFAHKLRSRNIALPCGESLEGRMETGSTASADGQQPRKQKSDKPGVKRWSVLLSSATFLAWLVVILGVVGLINELKWNPLQDFQMLSFNVEGWAKAAALVLGAFLVTGVANVYVTAQIVKTNINYHTQHVEEPKNLKLIEDKVGGLEGKVGGIAGEVSDLLDRKLGGLENKLPKERDNVPLDRSDFDYIQQLKANDLERRVSERLVGPLREIDELRLQVDDLKKAAERLEAERDEEKRQRGEDGKKLSARIAALEDGLVRAEAQVGAAKEMANEVANAFQASQKFLESTREAG